MPLVTGNSLKGSQAVKNMKKEPKPAESLGFGVSFSFFFFFFTTYIFLGPFKLKLSLYSWPPAQIWVK